MAMRAGDVLLGEAAELLSISALVAALVSSRSFFRFVRFAGMFRPEYRFAFWNSVLTPGLVNP
jgi:hypothetical protein